MPTGYTAAVGDGTVTAFPEFALTCARAFGALIMMRDEPEGTPIPDAFQPYEGNAIQAQQATARIAELQAMTPAACDAAALAHYNAECESRANRVRERTTTRERYELMLELTKDWKPPTPDHQEMKAFMVQRLEESIRFDCSGRYDEELAQLTGAQWRAAQMERAQKDVDYHTKAHAEELARTASRNAWVKALRDSLTPVAA